MKDQANNPEKKKFKFSVPSTLKSAVEGMDLPVTFELILWVQAVLFSAVMGHHLLSYLLLASHLLGIPIGIWAHLWGQDDHITCIPPYAKSNVVNFSDYANRKKGKKAA